jgi:hypothetical protein
LEAPPLRSLNATRAGLAAVQSKDHVAERLCGHAASDARDLQIGYSPRFTARLQFGAGRVILLIHGRFRMSNSIQIQNSRRAQTKRVSGALPHPPNPQSARCVCAKRPQFCWGLFYTNRTGHRPVKAIAHSVEARYLIKRRISVNKSEKAIDVTTGK